ncbi:hypothetical protein Taro_043964 [Colocasia esculenta]|uniref:Uncharacterized protein n=1 Tax=Colocasia esculenta TaxID=4460 RepID=A0A843X1R8_COLES|nr:hypothetical protein [Colocasia esculenta]
MRRTHKSLVTLVSSCLQKLCLFLCVLPLSTLQAHHLEATAKTDARGATPSWVMKKETA